MDEEKELEQEEEVLPQAPEIEQTLPEEEAGTKKGQFSFNEYLHKLKMLKIILPLIPVFSFFILIIIIVISSGGKSYDYSTGRDYVKGSVTEEELNEYLIDHQFCKDSEDCASSNTGKFYRKLKSEYEEYQSEKEVTLDIEMLIKTISYYRSDEEMANAMEELDHLIEAMVEEYQEEVEDPVTHQIKLVTKYRINMLQYRDYIIGTGDFSGSDSSGGTGGSTSQTKQEFLDWIVPLAKELQKVSGMLPSLTIAQKVQESGWTKGNSPIKTECHNYFGMKKGSWDGPYKVFRTWEHDKNGNKYYIDAAFRCYESDVEGFIGRGDFFWSYSRYADFLIYNFNHDWQNAVKAVKAAGYATDVNYVSALNSIINSNQLWQYDNDPDYQWDGTYPDYADYDPYTKQSINSGDSNSPGNSTEQYYEGGGYLERYRADLLQGYKDEAKFKRKQKIYEEMLNLSIDGKKENSGTSIGLTGACSSTPIKVTGNKYTISSHYGNRESPMAGASTNHKGVDLAYPMNTPVYAVGSGKVVRADYEASGCGNYVKIGHDLDGDGKYDNYTMYCHMTGYSVSEGQNVSCGQQIGQVGSTGISTGPHLHFALKDANDQFIDPEPLLEQLLQKNSIFDQTVTGDGSFAGYYNQGLYANVPYCNASQGTIATSGCGVAAIATAIANLKNQSVNIAQLANYVCTQTNYRVPGSGTNGGGLYTSEAFGQLYGIRGTTIPSSERNFESLYTALQSGKKITVSVLGGKFNNSGNGHYIALVEAKENKILVYDVGRSSNNGWYDKYVIQSEIINKVNTGMWYIENR